jgi:hypothetical protein
MCNIIPSNLLLDFDTPSQFNKPLEGIRVLGVGSINTSSFKSSFIKDTLLEIDVWHVDFLFKVGDVQVAFGILIHCYM